MASDQARWDSFVAPEGTYNKVFDLHVPTYPTAGPSNAAGSGVSSQLTSSTTTTTDLQALPPPPAYPSKLASITVRFTIPPPSSHGGGFLGGKRREVAANPALSDVPISPTLGQGIQALPPMTSTESSSPHDTASVHSSEDPTNVSTASAQMPASPSVGSAPIAIPGASSVAASASQPPPRRRTTLGLATLSSLGASMASGSGHGNQAASRPKAAFKGTNSSFIKSSEGLPLSPQVLKSLASVDPGISAAADVREIDRTFAVHTTGRMVVFSELSPNRSLPASTSSSTSSAGPSTAAVSAQTSVRGDPLAKIVFTASPTCVCINPSTASSSILDVLAGFNTGDIIYFDPFCARYTRFNKSGNVSSSPSTHHHNSIETATGGGSGGKEGVGGGAAVTSLLWIPGGGEREGLFMSGHADGSCLVWDKERDDPPSFVPNPWPPSPLSFSDDDDEEDDDAMLDGKSRAESKLGEGKDVKVLKAKLLGKSTRKEGRRTRDQRADDVVVTLNPVTADKKNKLNPITHWRVSRKAVKDLGFSPDLQHCAIVSEDGCLRIIDAGVERLLDTYVGYFGALSCVCWSSDGRFVFTGGQDDLVTVYSPLEQRVVARCQGHSSFVTAIAFDPWQSDDRTLRFASVSEDCKVIFWDLSSAALSRPRAAPTHVRRQSIGSTLSLSLSRRRTLESQTNLGLMGGVEREAMFHVAPGRNEVAILQPVIIRQISGDPLYSIHYHHNGLVTISRSGQVKLFSRPANRSLASPQEPNDVVGTKKGRTKRQGKRETLAQTRRRRGTFGEGTEAKGLLGGDAAGRYDDLRASLQLSVEA